MATGNRAGSPYAAPQYRAAGDPAFYHALHGAVPGHQIDFIYAPAVPQGPLTRTHFGHVARLFKYVEPREKAAFGFALGNLSRDDVQHEPGHGGLVLLLCRRAHGVIDHAGRAMPPYAHALIAVDRALDAGTLVGAATTFYRRFMDEGSSGAAGGFYQEYVEKVREAPESVERLLAEHIARFDDLPQPGRSPFGADFVAGEGPQPARVTVVLPDDEPFSTVASVAAELASVLYRSNVKWTAISNGREADIPGGLSVRLVPESEAPRDGQGPVFRLADLPSDDAELAEKLFGARPRRAGPAGREGWRVQYARKTGHAPAGAGRHSVPPENALVSLPAAPEAGPSPAGAMSGSGLSGGAAPPGGGALDVEKRAPRKVEGVVDTPADPGRRRRIFAGSGVAAAAVAATILLWPSQPLPEAPPVSPPVRTEPIAQAPAGPSGSGRGTPVSASGRGTPVSGPGAVAEAPGAQKAASANVARAAGKGVTASSGSRGAPGRPTKLEKTPSTAGTQPLEKTGLAPRVDAQIAASPCPPNELNCRTY